MNKVIYIITSISAAIVNTMIMICLVPFIELPVYEMLNYITCVFSQIIVFFIGFKIGLFNQRNCFCKILKIIFFSIISLIIHQVIIFGGTLIYWGWGDLIFR